MPTPNHIKAHIRPCLPEVSCGLVMIMMMIGVGQLSELSEGRPQMQKLQYTSLKFHRLPIFDREMQFRLVELR